MASMAANDRDDEALEIRHQNKTTPTVIAVVLVAVVAVLFLRDPGGTFEGDPVTTTRPLSEQTTTSEPALTTTTVATTRPSAIDPEFVPLRALAARDGDVFILTSRPGSLLHVQTTGLSETAARSVTHAVATEELFVVRTEQGEVLAAGADGAFRSVACCHSGLTPSNEPRHVWVLADGEGADLIDLRTRAVITELDFDARVGGPAIFGLVSLDSDGTAVWHRPRFDPSEVEVPEGRDPLAAGGEVVVYLADTDGTTSAAVEARRLSDGALMRSFDLPGSGPPFLALSTTGDAIALRRDGEAVVVDVATGEVLGELPAGAGPMVAVGQGRFAAIVGDDMFESDGRMHSTFVAEPLIIATRAE